MANRLFGKHSPSLSKRSKTLRPRLENLEDRDLPAPLTWDAGISLPAARGGIAAAMQNGAVAVFDGANADVPALTVADPTWQGSYSMDAPLPAAVAHPGVGLLPDGTVLVFGGQLNGTATNTATDYDYTGDSTTAAASMSTARAFFGFATDQNNNVYAIGGINQSGSRLSSVEYFNQDANSWTLVASLPQALSHEPAVADGAGHLFTFGGVGANGAATSNVYEYTIATKQWSQVASMPFAVRDSAAVLGANGGIYVLGGTTATGTTASVESYSPSSNTWTTEAPLPSPVSSEAAITDPLGRIEVIGGFDANGNPVANVWISQQLNQPDAAAVFSTTPVTQLYSWGQYQYQVLTTGNPQPTYSLTTAPTGMTIDPITGLINWTPTGQVGNQNVTIQASNYAGSTTQSFTISLVAPTLPATTPPQATALNAYSFTVPSTGNPTPTFSLVSGPAGMYMTQPSDGTVYWTPTLAQGGNQTFTVQASNYVGQVTQTYTVDVVSSIPLNVTAAGASTTSVTVSWLPVDDPAGATYDVYQRIGHIHGGYSDVLVASGMTGTSATIGGLTESLPGSVGYTYVVRATDNATGVQSPDSLPATSPTLFPPVLYGVSVNGADVGTVQATQGVPVQAQILWYANEAPTFSLVSGPSTMSVDPSTGIVTYTPGLNDLGTIQATVQATNSVGSATEVITYNVVPAPTIIFSDGPFTFNGYPFYATATAVGTDGVTPVSGTFTFTYSGPSNPPSFAGSYLVTAYFTSSDPNYGNTTATSTMIINPATAVFGGLRSPIIPVGQKTVYLSGTLLDGTTGPASGTVDITLNGVTKAASLKAGDVFSATLNTTGLAAGAYTVTYAYVPGDTDFTAQNATSTLYVGSKPKVTTQPVSQTVTAGSTVTFTAAASGAPWPWVLWQVSTNGGSTWTRIAGASSRTLTFTAKTGQNGYLYRAVFTNVIGKATTSAASLTVNAAPAFSANALALMPTLTQRPLFTATVANARQSIVHQQVSLTDVFTPLAIVETSNSKVADNGHLLKTGKNDYRAAIEFWHLAMAEGKNPEFLVD